jgi:putative transposase
MVRKRHKPEEMVAKLRQVDVLVSQGRSVADAIRSIGVTEVAERRTAEWRDFRHAAGGQSCDRELATARQQRAASCFSGLPAAGSGGVRARLRSLAGCAHPTSSAGQAARGEKANAELIPDPGLVDSCRGILERLGCDSLGLRDWADRF